jgi:hypothetical protein
VLESEARTVEPIAAPIEWRAANGEDLHGLFESTSIDGEEAASFWKIYYHFGDDGTYTGAALVIGGAQPQFQTLSGSWKLDERGLALGGEQLGKAFVEGDRLKLESGGLTLVMQRVTTQ